MNEPTRVGRPRKSELQLRSKNDARADLVRRARFSSHLSRSLQPCLVKDNRQVLERQLNDTWASIPSQKKKQKIEGLLAVHDLLKGNYVAEDGKEYDGSHVAVDEAMEVFFAFQNKCPPFINTDRDKFTYALLHQVWGLAVYIVYVEGLKRKFIVLRPDSFGNEVFLSMICAAGSNFEERPPDDGMILDGEKVKGIMDTVDTEWDRKVARVALCANRTRKQIHELGIDVQIVKTDTCKVITFFLYKISNPCCSFGCGTMREWVLSTCHWNPPPPGQTYSVRHMKGGGIHLSNCHHEWGIRTV